MSATPATPEPKAVESLLSSRRLTLILGALVLEVAIILIGLLIVPLSPATRAALVAANVPAPQPGMSAPQLMIFLFGHNFLVALAEMVPIAGPVVFTVAAYNTGVIAQALMVSQGLPAQWGLLIFVFPDAIVELSAYAVAVVAGSMFIVPLLRLRGTTSIRREARLYILSGVAVALILFVAAAMEAATIRVSPLLGFALWPVPIGLAVAAAVVVRRQRPAEV
jgi:hypothetical protein